MAEPSLNEILNIQGNSLTGSGEPAVVIDNSQAINNVLNAANQKAQYDWGKYQQFLKNQENFYQNVGELSKVEVATADRDAIASGYKNILKQALEHPEIFHGRNQKLYGELQQASGQLMQNATESKVNRLYDLSHREYLLKNPELNTPENVQKIENYFKQPLGSRQNYLLSMPGLFDPNELAKTINSQIEQPYTAASPIGGVETLPNGTQKLLPGENYIYEEQGKKYDPQKFMTLAEQSYNLPDKRGMQLRTEVTNKFGQLPPDLQQQYGGDPKKWYLALMQARMKDKAVDKSNLVANPNYMKAEQLRLEWAKYGLAKEKLNKEKSDDIIGADSVINEIGSILDNGEENVITAKGFDRKGTTKDLMVIDDPTLLQSFAHIDKDGKMINQPDEVQYDKDTGELYLTYLQKNKDGSPVYSNGKRLIKERKGLNERTWAKMVVKRSFPNKDVGAINSLVDKVLTANDNSFYKLWQNKTGKSTQQSNIPTAQSFKHSAKMGDGSIIYSNDGKTWYNQKGKLIE